jgi:hypothetical protein
MDIGGSLTKVVVCLPHADAPSPFLAACKQRMPRHPGFAGTLSYSDAESSYSFLKCVGRVCVVWEGGVVVVVRRGEGGGSADSRPSGWTTF